MMIMNMRMRRLSLTLHFKLMRRKTRLNKFIFCVKLKLKLQS